MLKRWKNKYAGQTLHRKVRLSILMFSLLPLVLIACISFYMVYHEQMLGIKEEVQEDLQRQFSDMRHEMDTIQMMANTIWADTTFTTEVGQAAINDSLGEYNRFIFQRRTLSTLRIITNINHVQCARLHMDYPGLREYASYLYHMDRAKMSFWYADRERLSYQGEWYLNALDEQSGGIYDNYLVGKNMASYVIPVKISNDLTGIFEIVLSMNALVPDLYVYEDVKDTFLVDAGGRILGIEENGMFDEVTVEYLRGLMGVKSIDSCYLQGVQIYQGYWHHEPVILSAVKDEESGIWLMQLVTIREQYRTMMTEILLILFSEILMSVLLYTAINRIVEHLLHDFHVFSECIGEVANGTLDVEIPQLEQVEINAVAMEYNRMLGRVKELMETAIRREVMVKEAQLKSLEKQIDSHFLYNVLDSIKMMAEVKGIYQVSDALLALGRMFRYNLQIDSHSITLQEEIAYLESYLSLHNIRSDYRIYLSENIADAVKKLKVPKVVLQPIAENSITHGLDELTEDTAIYLKAYIDGDCACIELTDMGKGMSAQTLEKVRQIIANGGGCQPVKGIGLRNIHERIQLMYGEQYGVSVYSKAGCYTKVVLTIPVEV